MGLFKDFKDDFSDAVDELVPTDETSEKEDVMVNTLDEDVDVDSELNKLDGLLEQVAKKLMNLFRPVLRLSLYQIQLMLRKKRKYQIKIKERIIP